MLNITSIKSEGEEKLKAYKMVIAFKPDTQKEDHIFSDCVVQGVMLEYTYSHDCFLIPLEPLDRFWETNLAFDYIKYYFKTNLATLEDIAEHIRALVDDVDSVTIYLLDVKEN